MPRKSMIQGCKRSNCTSTVKMTAGTGSQSYKKYDRHPYDKWNTDTAMQLTYQNLKNLIE